MRRFFVKVLPLLAGSLLLVMAVLAAAPFTEFGTRMLLRSIAGLLPVQVEYVGGSLAGKIELSKVYLDTDSVTMDLRDIEAQLQLSCLWNSRFCFSHLAAGTIDVSWDGGSWHSGATEVRGSVAGSTIVVDSLQSVDALLTLTRPEGAREKPEDSSITLPIDLLLHRVTLERAAWEIYGTRHQHESITLKGRWVDQLLQLEQLELANSELGVLQATGQVRFSGDWPFELESSVNWKGSPFLADVLPHFISGTEIQTDSLANVPLLSPWRFLASGTMAEQSLSGDVAISGLGYAGLQLSFNARHLSPDTGQEGRAQLLFDRIELRDPQTQSELVGTGELYFGERIRWQLSVQSHGFSLPAISEELQGQLAGSFESSGHFSGETWGVALGDIDLQGAINDLPARIAGQLNLNETGSLSAIDLDADLNGASLQVVSQEGSSRNLGLQLTVAELGRWLPGSSGSLSASGSLSPVFKLSRLRGKVRDFQWRDVGFKQGDLSGWVDLTDSRAFKLRTVIKDAVINAVPLIELSLSASGNAQQQTLQLDSTGGIAISLVGESELSLEDAKGSLVLGGDVSSMASLLAEGYELSSKLKLVLNADWRGDASSPVAGEVQLLQPELRREMLGGQISRVSWDSASLFFNTQGDSLRLTAQGIKDKKKILSMHVSLPAQKDSGLSGELALHQLDLEDMQAFAPTLIGLKGIVDGQISLSGTGQQLLGHGQIELVDGGFSVVDTPTPVEALQLQIKLQGDKAEIRGGLLLGGGKLDISGSLGYNPEPFVELTLLGERETLLFPPSTRLLLSHNIVLRATTDYLDVSGDLIVHEGVLEHEELPKGAIALSEDVVVVGYVGPQPRSFDLGMDVQVTIEEQFKVVGSVVDVTVGGNLHLLQERGRPLQLFGNLNVVGGELRAYGQHLKVKRGTVVFSGAPENPALDMRAERIIARENITVGVELNGTLEAPVLEVYSDPLLSNTESLSYLVRGRGLDAGAGADGTALAISMGASIVNQTGVLGNLDKLPGISGVEIGAEGTDDDTTATVSGYIGNRIYLSYGVGLYEPINVLTARLYLQTRLWLEVVSSLDNSLDLYYSFDIE